MKDLLARIAILRLTLYVLSALWLWAGGLAALKLLPYAPGDMAWSLLVLGLAGWSVNAVFARVFGARSNPESVLITILILALVITPFGWRDMSGAGYAIFAAAWAMGSKYMLASSRRHWFNPAAFGMALAALALGTSVSWWVGGSPWLLAALLPGGALILAKMRCYDLVLGFAVAVLASVAIATGASATALEQVGLHSMFLFFAFVMLTEPRTAPVGQKLRIAYAVLTGILFAPELHLGSFYFTPELALLAGNVFALAASPRRWPRWTRNAVPA
jgi:Na+-transporting NADH:ubiquinone oxidoreductase subunit NqrB